MEIIKNEHPIFSFLKGKKEGNKNIFIFDTETTGLGTIKEAPGLLEFYGLKFKLQKDLSFFIKDKNKIVVKFNDYTRTLELKDPSSLKNFNISTDDIKDGINLSDEKEIIFDDNGLEVGIELKKDRVLFIEEDIPFLKYYDNNGLEKKELLFNSIGKFVQVDEYDRLFKSDIEIEPKAMVVHKIFDSSKIKSEDIIKIIDRYIERYEKLENPRKIKKIKEIKKEVFDLSKNIDEKNEDLLKEKFLDFTKEFGFRDNRNCSFINETDVKEISSLLNDNIVRGHNVYTFDIHNVIERNGFEELKNPLIVDTMHFAVEIGDTKTNNMDKLVRTFLAKELKRLKVEYKKALKHIKYPNDHLTFSNILEKHWFDFDLNKETKVNEIEPIPLEDFNDLKEISKKHSIEIITDFENLNSILEKKFQRKTVHTAKLDIELNTFVLESQLKEYVSKHGLEDVLTIEKEVKNLSEINQTQETMEINGYLGLKTSFSKGVCSNTSKIIERLKEIGIEKSVISDENFADAFKNLKAFESNGMENYNSFELTIEGTPHKVNIILTNPKDLDVLLLISERKIKVEHLKLINERLNAKILIPPEFDKEISGDNIFIKVEPYKIYNYEQNFNNKRVLWINNGCTSPGNIEKGLFHFWNTISNNKKSSPMEDNNRIYHPEKFQDRHIPSKEELFSIFPVNKFKDIYENSNKIISECKVFKPIKQNIKPLPEASRLIENLKTSPKTSDEYKNLMFEELRIAWKKMNMNEIIKKTAIEKYFKEKKTYFNSLSNEEKQGLTIEQKKLARKIVVDTDLSVLSSNKKEFIKFIDNELIENEEFKERFESIKNEYTSRIKYEVESLRGFSNYETVFNYYFQMRKILKTLENNGIGHGPGRGSAAGSLIAYMLEITKIDPIRYGLLFERFMNPERVSMPDIDIDIPLDEFITKDYVISILEKDFKLSDEDLKKLLVEDNGFDPVLVDEMIKNNYTKYASKIATKILSSDKTVLTSYLRTRGKPQNAIRNFQREYNSDDNIVDNIENLDDLNLSFIKKIKDNVEDLSGLILSEGRHAGGVMIPNLPENTICMVKDNTSVFDKDIPEHETKWDLLGLKGMVLHFLLRLKEEKSMVTNKVENFDFNYSVLEDTNIWKLIQEGKNRNVFQIESSGMKEMLKKLAPLDFDTLIAALRLFRPGPLEAGAVDAYITNKYLSIKNEYKRFLPNPEIYDKDGKFTIPKADFEEQVGIAYNNIVDKKFKKLVDLNLFTKIMSSTPYFDSKEFSDKVANSLNEILNMVSQSFGNLNDDLIDELNTTEKIFYDEYLNSNKDIEKAKKRTIQIISNLEKEILNSPSFSEITKDTYGTIVYQEQIMEISTKISGFTKGESDVLRKAVGKSDAKLLASLKEKIVNGMIGKLDKIEVGDIKIERNQDFESVLTLNGKKINLFNSKFSVVDKKINFELTPDLNKLFNIYKNIGGDISDIENSKIEVDKKEKEIEQQEEYFKTNERTDELLEKLSNLKKERYILNEKYNEEMEKLKSLVLPKLNQYFENIVIEDNNQTIIKTFDKRTREYLFDKIVGFGRYAFNKSHSRSYRFLTYDFAFHKYYYPEKFYSLALKQSSLESAQEIFREILEDQSDKKINIKINQLNKINKDFDYDLEKKTITFSPIKIKSIKKKSIISICEELKKNGDFTSLFDLRNRIPRSLLGKTDFFQLGRAGVLDEQIFPLTPKLFEEQFENINEILEERYLKNLENLKTSILNKFHYSKIDVSRYFLLSNKVKNNEIIDVQIKEYKDQVNRLQNVFNSSLESEQEKIKEDISKIFVELQEWEGKKTIFSKEEIEFLKSFEENNKEEFEKFLKFDISMEEIIKDLIQKIERENSVEVAKEFTKRVSQRENFTEEEFNKVNMDIFAEYNFKNVDINVRNKEMNKETLKNFIDGYYQDVNSSLELNLETESFNKEEVKYFIGKNPKILVLVDTIPTGTKRNKIIFNGEELVKKDYTFENNEGKTIPYSRYFSSNKSEFKTSFNKETNSVELFKKENKKWIQVNEGFQILNENVLIPYFDKLFKESNSNLTVDNLAIMSLFPYGKKSHIHKKVLNSEIFGSTLKKHLKEKKFEIPVILASGVETIKRIKKIHSSSAFTTDYYFPYSFNWNTKESQKNKTYKEMQVDMTSLIFIENGWSGFMDDLDKIKRIEKLTSNSLELIKSVENKSIPSLEKEVKKEYLKELEI